MIGCVVALLFVSGCYYGPDHPRRMAAQQQSHEYESTPGTRLIVEDGQGEPVIKLRVRSRRTRVYDAKMIPVGQIRPDGDEFELRSRDGKTRLVTKWLDDERAELADRWRVERAHGGAWDLFGGDDHHLARLHSDDEGQWVLESVDGDRWLRIDRDDSDPKVVDGDQTVYLHPPHGDWSDPKILALLVDDLPLLERVALALWLEANLD